MNIPFIVRVHIRKNNKSQLRLWFPLFFIYPFVVPVLLLLVLICYILLLILLRFRDIKRFSIFVASSFTLWSHLGGLEIDVKDKNSSVFVCIKYLNSRQNMSTRIFFFL